MIKEIPPSINTLGNHFLYNPEDLPEKVSIYGPGTERPCGLTLSQLCTNFWTVKSFKVTATAVNFLDYLTTFLVGGGASGTLVGSLTGLVLSQLLSSGSFLAGFTKISVISSAKIRRSIYGVNNGVSQANYKPLIGKNSKDQKDLNPLALDEEVNPHILKSFRNDINEGSISIGAYHKLTSSGGTVMIDFSDILYAKGLYWPKIIIMLGPLSGIGPIFSSVIIFKDLNLQVFNAFGSWNLPTIGGINFMGSVIPMFGSQVYFPGYTFLPTPVFGEIFVDKTIKDGYLAQPCKRLYWDGVKDEDRENFDKEQCDQIIQKTKDVSSSSSSSF